MEIQVVHAFIYFIQAILELIKLWENQIYPLKKKERMGMGGGVPEFYSAES